MFSRQSAAFIVGGLFTVAVGRLFGLQELFIMGAALIACVIIAMLLVSFQRPKITIDRVLQPSDPEAGQTLHVGLTLVTNSRVPACDVFEFTEDGSKVHIALAPLPSGQVARANYQLSTPHRGTLILGPSIVELSDPLGLAHRSKPLGQATEVTVFPQSVSIDLPHPVTSSGDLVDFIRRAIRHQPTSSEFKAMREYSVGDDPRRINWKVSAKREDLIVNEYENEIELNLQVVLDTRRSSYSPESFERSVSIAASFARSVSRQNNDNFMQVGFACGPRNFDVTSGAQSTEVLQHLAEVDTTVTETFKTTLREPARLKVDIIISGKEDSQRIESIWKQNGSAKIVVVIFCEDLAHNSADPLNLPTHWFVLSCQNLEQFAESWRPLCSQSVKHFVRNA
jgi:uncharacterized protein (DUF58 family)